jgi:hypothetical protein
MGTIVIFYLGPRDKEGNGGDAGKNERAEPNARGKIIRVVVLLCAIEEVRMRLRLKL